jgi:hypothetical protein
VQRGIVEETLYKEDRNHKKMEEWNGGILE